MDITANRRAFMGITGLGLLGLGQDTVLADKLPITVKKQRKVAEILAGVNPKHAYPAEATLLYGEACSDFLDRLIGLSDPLKAILNLIQDPTKLSDKELFALVNELAPEERLTGKRVEDRALAELALKDINRSIVTKLVRLDSVARAEEQKLKTIDSDKSKKQ